MHGNAPMAMARQESNLPRTQSPGVVVASWTCHELSSSMTYGHATASAKSKSHGAVADADALNHLQSCLHVWQLSSVCGSRMRGAHSLYNEIITTYAQVSNTRSTSSMLAD